MKKHEKFTVILSGENKYVFEMNQEYRKGFQKALKETYFLLENLLLNEGMDIRAFEKLSDDVEFQKACQLFKSRIQADNDAKLKFKLNNLNDFKNSPKEFIRVVDSALEYIEKRRKQKNIRRAQRKEGVKVVYDDENCLITAVDSPKYAREAGSLLKGVNSCPWCVANAYPDNVKFWEQYNVAALVFIYKKRNGEPYDALCMVITPQDILKISLGAVKEDGFFSVLETLSNENNYGSVKKLGLNFYRGTLSSIKMTSEEFKNIVFPTLSKVRVSAEEKNGALINAIEEKNRDFVESLLKTGMDVNRKFRTSPKPLIVASLIGSCDICNILIQNGADVNVKGYGRETALGYATRYAHERVVEILLQSGADANLADIHGVTPLMNAAQKGQADLCKLLLKHGANVNAKTLRGTTALDFARHYQFEDVMNVLKKAGAV